MAEATLRNFTLNFGPQHPAAHGVLRDLAAHGASASGQSAAAAGVPVDAEHTRRMTRQTYRRRERENRNERPAGKRYQHSGGWFDYTAEAIEPSYPGFDGLGRAGHRCRPLSNSAVERSNCLRYPSTAAPRR